MNKLVRVWWWLVDLLRPHGVFVTEVVDDFPEILASNRVYLVGDSSAPWCVALVCPCGCGAFIQLSLVNKDHPRWHAKRHFNGTVTLEPSIWRKKGCRSHFFLRRGRIIWTQEFLGSYHRVTGGTKCH